MEQTNSENNTPDNASAEAPETEADNLEEDGAQTAVETTQEISQDKGLVFFSPEGIMMMSIAMGLDLMGFTPLGEMFIPDVLGLIIISAWLFFRSQGFKMTSGAQSKMGKLGGKGKVGRVLGRFGCVMGEFIPIVGVLPLWSLLVYKELHNS